MITFRDEGSPAVEFTNSLFIITGDASLDMDSTGIPRITVTAGAGSVTGSGTSGTITKFTGTSSIGNSIMTESGTTITVANTLNATNLGGTLSTAAQPNITSVGTLTSLTIAGNLTFTAAVTKIIPGATSIQFRNNADTNSNIVISDAGNITFRAGLSGITTISMSSTLTMSLAASRIIPGATSLSFRNNANSADNILISNAGAVTFRAGLSGITTLSMSGQLTNTVTTGTAPFVISSTTKVTNLNADQLDGLDSTAFLQTSAISGSAGTIVKFATSSTLGNSIITESGTTIAIAGGLVLNSTSARLSIGVSATNSHVGLYLRPEALLTGSTSQYGIYGGATVDSGATVAGVAGYMGLRTEATSFTCANGYGLYIADAVVGAGSAITTYRGLSIGGAATGTSNNYGIAIGAVGGGSTNNVGINIADVTGTGAFAIKTASGVVRFGDVLWLSTASTPNNTIGFAIDDDLTLSGAGGFLYGTAIYPTFDAASGSSEICGLYVTGTSSGSGTSTTVTGIKIDTFTKGGSHTIDNYGGLIVGAPPSAVTSWVTGIEIKGLTTAGTQNNGIYINAISGAATNNYGIRIQNVSGAGTGNYAIYTGTGEVRFGDQMRMSTLGLFSNATAPSHDQLLSYDSGISAWTPRTVQLSFNAGLMTASQLSDGTAWTGASDGGVTEVGSATGPTPDVVVGYHSITVYMGAIPGTAPGANQVYYVYYQKNGTGGWVNGPMKTIGTAIVHTNLDMTATYSYKVKINSGGTLGTASSVIDMSTNASAKTAQVNPFVLVAASQISTINLAAINADLGTIVTGLIQNSATAPTAAIRLNTTYSVPGEADVTSGMLSHSGMGSFSAANCVDGNTGTVGWNTDTATAGAYVQIDLGASNDKDYVKLRMYTTAASSTAQYKIQYSDNGSSWTDAVFFTGTTAFVPAISGWNYFAWPSVGPHRYWRITLMNTPGAGPDIAEIVLSSMLNLIDFSSSATNIMELGADRFVLGTTGDLTVRANIAADALSVYGSAVLNADGISGTQVNTIAGNAAKFGAGVSSMGQTAKAIQLDDSSLWLVSSAASVNSRKMVIIGNYSKSSSGLTARDDTGFGSWTTNSPNAQAVNPNTWYEDATNRPTSPALSSNMPSYDGWYAVQYDVNVSNSALNATGYGGTDGRIDLYYDTNGASGWTLYGTIYSEGLDSTAGPNDIISVNNAVANVYIPTLTTNGKIQLRYWIKVNAVKILSGAAYCYGNADNTSWYTSGGTTYTRRTLYLNEEANKPQLIFEPVVTAPTASNAFDGEFWYGGGSTHALCFVDNSNTVIHLGKATTTQEGVIAIPATYFGGSYTSPTIIGLRMGTADGVSIDDNTPLVGSGSLMNRGSGGMPNIGETLMTHATGTSTPGVCKLGLPTDVVTYQNRRQSFAWRAVSNTNQFRGIGCYDPVNSGTGTHTASGDANQQWILLTANNGIGNARRSASAGSGGSASYDEVRAGQEPTFIVTLKTGSTFAGNYTYAGLSSAAQDGTNTNSTYYLGFKIVTGTLYGALCNNGTEQLTSSLGSLTSGGIAYTLKVRCSSTTAYFSFWSAANGWSAETSASTGFPTTTQVLGALLSVTDQANDATDAVMYFGSVYVEYGK